jgi:hypothetical protein
MFDFQSFLPQRTFLFQGTSALFEKMLLAENIKPFISYTLSVPRFTTAHSQDVVAHMGENTGSERVFVIYFAVFSPDAAQALLKSLEEPMDATSILLITPYPYLVPATVRSRVVLIHSLEDKQHIQPYTKASALAYIKQELDTDADEPAIRRAKAVTFLDALERQTRTNSRIARYVYSAKHMLFHGNMPVKYVVDYAVAMIF